MFAQTRKHGEAGQHFERRGSAWRIGQFRSLDQLFVDLLLFRDAQAIGHLDHANTVDEGLVVLVGLEGLPFRFVRMR